MVDTYGTNLFHKYFFFHLPTTWFIKLAGLKMPSSDDDTIVLWLQCILWFSVIIMIIDYILLFKKVINIIQS